MDTHMDGYIRVRVLLTAPPTASPRPLATIENEHWTQTKTNTNQAGYIARYRRLYVDKLRLKTSRQCVCCRILCAIMNVLKLVDSVEIDCKVKRQHRSSVNRRASNQRNRQALPGNNADDAQK